MKKRFNLLLIRPRQIHKHYSTQFEMAKLMGKKTANSVLALPLLAAHTPDNYKIKIIDEEINGSAKNYKADLVGITMITSNSERGYELALHYRNKGAKVILGGPFASYACNEALNYADAVVIGEAESLWKEVLNDFENKNLKNIYRSNDKEIFETSVVPRWDLIRTDKILSINVQASRGCPFKCEFCLTSEFFGQKIRRRKIENIVNEIKQLPLKNIFFVDDNLTINKTYAAELFDAIAPLKTSWMCQSSVDVADDMTFLKKMADAGCKFILIGFESLNNKSLEETGKYQNNKEEYLKIIERIHSVGIYVYASFIIGFDNDTHKDFEIFKSFINESALPVFILNLLGVTKGTRLHDRLEKEGRLFTNLSKNFNVGAFPVFKHPHFETKELYDAYYNLLYELYDFKNIYKRVLKLYGKGYFSKNKPQGSISIFLKIRTSIFLIISYYFSSNIDKRNLFKSLIKYIKQKKLAPAEAVSMLLMIEGIKRHLEKSKKIRPEFFEALNKVNY